MALKSPKKHGRPLTVRQEKFCHEIIAGKNQTEAYRAAYNIKGGATKTVWENASRVADNSKVSARIAELRAPAAAKVGITLESHLEDLAKLRNLAVKENQIAAAITAEIARGKAAGVHVEKSQINLNNLNPMVIVLQNDNG